MTTGLKKEIQKLARESVREALQNEFDLMSILDIPVASQKEQQEIVRLYKKPSRQGVRTLRTKI
ncbi:MAG: hypothetical protein ABSE76_00830 [Minisyncoccia bacterium]|jgi:hypothetical protein